MAVANRDRRDDGRFGRGRGRDLPRLVKQLAPYGPLNSQVMLSQSIRSQPMVPTSHATAHNHVVGRLKLGPTPMTLMPDSLRLSAGPFNNLEIANLPN